MVTIASLGGGASRNRSSFCLLFFVEFFFASGDNGAIVGKPPLPQYHVSFGGTQEETQRSIHQTLSSFGSPNYPQRLIVFWPTWKEVFPWRWVCISKVFPRLLENCLVQLIKLLMVQRSGKAQLTGARTHLNWFAANKIQRRHTKKQPSKKKAFLQSSSCFCPKNCSITTGEFFGFWMKLNCSAAFWFIFSTEAWSELWVGSWFRWVMEPSNDHRCGSPLELVGWELVG